MAKRRRPPSPQIQSQTPTPSAKKFGRLQSPASFNTPTLIPKVRKKPRATLIPPAGEGNLRVRPHPERRS